MKGKSRIFKIGTTIVLFFPFFAVILKISALKAEITRHVD